MSFSFYGVRDVVESLYRKVATAYNINIISQRATAMIIPCNIKRRSIWPRIALDIVNFNLFEITNASGKSASKKDELISIVDKTGQESVCKLRYLMLSDLQGHF